MDRKASAAVIILIFLIVISLALSGGLYVFLQKEKVANIDLQKQLEDIKTQQSMTKKDLDEYKKKASGLELKLKDTQNQIEALTADLESQKTAKSDALAQVESVRSELALQKNARADLEKKFNQAQEDIKKSQEQIAVMETKKVELETKVKELESKSNDLEVKLKGIELGTIVVPSQETAGAKSAKKTVKKTAKKAEKKAPVKDVKKEVKKEQPKKEVKKETKVEAVKAVKAPAVVPVANLEGSVLVVNKEYNFAVINLGNKDKVKEGDIFSVYHQDKFIGDLKVEKVHDAMSAAGFLSEDIKDMIVEADKVVQKK